MLKRVTIHQLRPGMYLHKLEGSWLQHPFLRSRFLLSRDGDVQALRDSGIRHVWIDVSRGIDVGEAEGGDASVPGDGRGTAVARVPDPAASSEAASGGVPSTEATAEGAASETGGTVAGVSGSAPLAGPALTESRSARRRRLADEAAAAARAAGSSDDAQRPGSGDRPAFGSPPPVAVVSTMSSEVGRAHSICDAGREQVARIYANARAGQPVDVTSTAQLVDEIAASLQRNPAAILAVARHRSREDYTHMHSVAVCALMMALSRQLGHDDPDILRAGQSGLMHDVGKACIPAAILDKPGRLTDEEFAQVRRHSALGAELLRQGGADEVVVNAALHHHEKLDGTGYPFGLKEGDISIHARMAAICDVYDAVTSTRPYKMAWNPADAIRQMSGWHGHFDRTIFNAFVKTVGLYPVGSLVRTSSNRLAVVIEPGRTSLLKPTLRIFYSVKAREPIPEITIDLADKACREEIEAIEDPQAWGFRNLDAHWLD